uniref:Myb/SANT-like domain-containing protein n=1 Tax=Lactuca sativa TaxID=4236 RepID=A0A9R1WAS9_LACSA|nr:hypothetical protein LSAT_V11C200056610 [Lactuca sativa]
MILVLESWWFVFGMIEKSRNYTTWTTHEDAKLVEAMLKMVNAGGFKADNIVYDMNTDNDTNGFGYDNVNRCGTVESPEVWDSYVKLCIILGNGSSQGNRVEYCKDMSHNENVEEELLEMEDDFSEQSEEISPTINGRCEETSSASTMKKKRTFDPFVERIPKVATLLDKDLRDASTTMSQSFNVEVEL